MSDSETFHEDISTKQLLLALNPPRIVFERWREETPERDEVSKQDDFAELIQECIDYSHGPPDAYLKLLVKYFMDQRDPADIESETLMECYANLLGTQTPRGNEALKPAYATFHIDDDSSPLRLRVFPKHNDVSLRLWEAGALLAEFLYANPHYVADKRVVEFGAGVGATGLVAAGCCDASHVHITDYTEVCLGNMAHNIEINRDWLKMKKDAIDSHYNISSGHLEWGAYANGEAENDLSHRTTDEASVLLAADVAYDVNELDSLVNAWDRFISVGRDVQKTVIYAMTLRNKSTFSALMELMKEADFKARLLCAGSDNFKLPILFPMNFVQSRDEVRIYELYKEYSVL